MADTVVVGRLAQALLDVLDPLRKAVQSPEAFEALMRREGWQPPPTREYFATVSDSFKLVGALETAAGSIESLLSGNQPDAGAILAAIDAVVKVISDVRSIAKPAGVLPPPFDSDDFWSTFSSDLIADLFLRYMEVAQPTLFAPLHLLGILDEELVKPDGAPHRVAYTRSNVEWGRLVTLVSDPTSLARDVYGWGATFDHDKLMRRLERVLLAFGIPVGRYVVHQSLLDRYYASGPAPDGVRELRVPLLEDRRPDVGFVRVGLLALAIPPAATPNGAPVGFFVGPYAYGQAATRVELGGPLALELKGGLESAGDVGVEMRPGAFGAHLGTSGTTLDVEAALALEPNTPFILLGSENSHRLQLGKSRLGLSVSGPVASPEVQLSLQFDSLALVFDPSDGDSFLTELFGRDAKTAEASGAITWSSRTGLHFKGEATLKIAIPLHTTIGPLTIQGIGFEIAAGTQNVALNVTVSGGAHIGPVQAAIQDVGVTFSLTPVSAPARGTFGDLDLDFGFKSPSGVGLAIDVAGLVGGGFLKHDEAAQQYAGVLQLAFQSYQLQAFGLLATKLPTGPGYSLVAMIDAEFPPIPLGFGFTLNGVGGLFGVHRMASVDALRASFAAHTLSSILFPRDPIANAPQILTVLDTVFPPADGRFVFGPLARIGWGTPTLVTIDLAIVVELPSPVRIVLIAEIQALLPDPSVKLVELHVSALGTIDFGKGEGALDAAVHDSRLSTFTLHGSMALRVNWSGNKTFLLAVGGFNPRFQPPPGFPKLDRLGVSLTSSGLAKLNLDGYLAITSNTLQLGAKVDLFVGVDGFGIAGYLGFDALIQFRPFHFDGDISGGVTLSFDGEDLMSLRLAGTLSGPAPWHAEGSVSFDVLWWTVTKSFSHTFGDPASEQALDRVDVGQLLRDAFADPRNYSAVLTNGRLPLVTLTPPANAAAVVLAHPDAVLDVHQRVVPLGLTIARFGNGAPLSDTRFDITNVSADNALQWGTPLLDDFAPAQFLTLSDDDKLASPSFERLVSGVELGSATVFGSALPASAAINRTIAYDTFFVDTVGAQPREDTGVPAPFQLGVLTAVLAFGAAGRAPLATGGAQRYAGPQRAVTPATLDFVVATSDQLAASGVGASVGQSYTQARAALDAELALHPERRGGLRVVARYEVGT
jgi:hypothetical protein